MGPNDPVQSQLVRSPLFFLLNKPAHVCVCVYVWYSVGNGIVPVGLVMRLVHPIKAPLPPQRIAMWRGFGEARCPTIVTPTIPGRNWPYLRTYVSLLI